jgi:hypothetical protein
MPTRRKNAFSMLSALSNTFAAFGRFGSRDFDRHRFNARPLEQLLREPRTIEILNQKNVAHFQSDVSHRWLKLRCFLQEERGNPPKLFATRKNSGAALERIISAGARIVAGRTEPTYRLLRSGDRLRNALCETRDPWKFKARC